MGVARLWNGKDLDQVTPELGLRLDFASLIPQFAAQLLESGLCDGATQLLLTPLDDLKGWLRTQVPGEAGLKHDVRQMLLEQEEIDKAALEKTGATFDVVEYELSQLAADDTYEQFNVEWVQNILNLVLEEADAIQAWTKAELNTNFALSVSFSLPDPRRHAELKPAAIEAALKQYGTSDKVITALLKGTGKRPETSGMLTIELSERGKPVRPQAAGGTSFVEVAIVDHRAGDTTDASLCLAYPRELEGYFLLSFDELRRRLTLKEEA